MKEQYVGDVNDYRKYALLRLLGRSGLKLGVCWMLTPGDGRSDGNKLAYLDKPRDHERHDPELFTLLQRVKDQPDARRLALIEGGTALPNAVFINTLVPDALVERQLWFKQATEALAKTEFVFFDPDNGIEIKSLRMGRRNSSKFVYLDELEATYAHGQSLLIYQHFPREERIGFVQRIATAVRGIAPDAEIWAVTTKHVVFILLIQPKHRATLSTAAKSIFDSADPGFLRSQLIERASA